MAACISEKKNVSFFLNMPYYITVELTFEKKIRGNSQLTTKFTIHDMTVEMTFPKKKKTFEQDKKDSPLLNLLCVIQGGVES